VGGFVRNQHSIVTLKKNRSAEMAALMVTAPIFC
jgi:hypothetical protein